MFISLEGPEGSGKGTISRYLTRKLKKIGIQVSSYRDPGSTTLGKEIRQLVLHAKTLTGKEMAPHAVLLAYTAARSQLVFKRIRPDLRDKKVVIVDRFADSTRAIQAAQGEQQADIERINRFATRGIEPHVTIVLDVPVKIGLERKRAQGEWTDWEALGEEFHESVRRRVKRQVFQIIQERLVKRGILP